VWENPLHSKTRLGATLALLVPLPAPCTPRTNLSLDGAGFSFWSIQRVADGITVIRLNELGPLDQMSAMLRELAERDIYRLRIFDTRGARLHADPKELSDMAMVAKTILTKPSRVAWVVDSDLSYGLLRVFSAYRTQDTHTISKVFWDMEAAMDWLKEQDPTF
jgi:hypothetical protein